MDNGGFVTRALLALNWDLPMMLSFLALEKSKPMSVLVREGGVFKRHEQIFNSCVLEPPVLHVLGIHQAQL